MEKLIEEMANDGFFGMIGLDKMFQAEQRREPKKPQDHKKKSSGKVIEK